jgi:hypothetical protein
VLKRAIVVSGVPFLQLVNSFYFLRAVGSVSARRKQNNGGKRIVQGYTSCITFAWSTNRLQVLIVMYLTDIEHEMVTRLIRA